jgi:hypothetical protein
LAVEASAREEMNKIWASGESAISHAD